MPAGRPTDYSPELAARICAEIANGKSMRTICKSDDMPCMATVFKWLGIHPEFVEQYTQAKQEQAEAMIEDMLDIADNEASNPLIVDGLPLKIDGEIVKITDGPSVNHARLRVDTRKWIASKLKPKKYGERITQEHEGKIDLSGLSDEQLDERIKALLHGSG